VSSPVISPPTGKTRSAGTIGPCPSAAGFGRVFPIGTQQVERHPCRPTGMRAKPEARDLSARAQITFSIPR